jgi:hypothetical protein
MVLSRSRPGGCFAQIQTRLDFPARGLGRNKAYRGGSGGGSGNPLRIRNYYILCSSDESRLIIVARASGCKRFLMHTKGNRKAPPNQRNRPSIPISPPTIHGESAVLSTALMFMRVRHASPPRRHLFSRQGRGPWRALATPRNSLQVAIEGARRHARRRTGTLDSSGCLCDILGAPGEAQIRHPSARDGTASRAPRIPSTMVTTFSRRRG